jgi:hypothetical protein
MESYWCNRRDRHEDPFRSHKTRLTKEFEVSYGDRRTQGLRWRDASGGETVYGLACDIDTPPENLHRSRQFWLDHSHWLIEESRKPENQDATSKKALQDEMDVARCRLMWLNEWEEKQGEHPESADEEN